MSEQETHILTYSSNRGRYCFDDSETGHDVTTGEPVSIEVTSGVWIDGYVQHSGGYNQSGCYNINDAGRPHSAVARAPREPLTQENLQKQIQAATSEGMSLADAFDAVTGKVSALFCGYYFMSDDGLPLGLCTGMHIRSRT